MKKALIFILLTMVATVASAREIHVSVNGDDNNRGTTEEPLKTISAAAVMAQPGDIITVHEGVYRERVSPPRGGSADERRIVYQAKAGEKVIVKGSEIIKDWNKVKHDTWKVEIPNNFFGDFNPYSDLIRGDWFLPKNRQHHTGAVYLDGHWLTEATGLEEVMKPVGETPFWFAQVDDTTTTIWAQFKDVNPNTEEVEINVRQSVFYPAEPGKNYITVRGFTMMHAATPWAPPTAEQVGLLGTHWSKGWIIEDNDISYSVCTGVTLGKYGDEFDNTSQNTSAGYVETIKRALKNGWSKENIGHHVVRNNHISHCEQAGIVGSMGAAFSRVTGNVIHDIHVRRLFSGAEMAGIKFHAAIDTVISRNHIYRTRLGIWLDWMSQGTRVTRNLLHENQPFADLFTEVNHGPFMVDNNLFLSSTALDDMSQGGAYVHNLFAGKVLFRQELRRVTPYHTAHSTEIAGQQNIPGGDDRFVNNIFVSPANLSSYEQAAMPLVFTGNVYLNGAIPCEKETDPMIREDFDPGIKLDKKNDTWQLHIKLDTEWSKEQPRPLVTSDLLGKAAVTDLPYVQADDSPYLIDIGYFGRKREVQNPFPGPFAQPEDGQHRLTVWPLSSSKEKDRNK
jgi:alpha-N-arabinofuranosidase